MIGGSDGWPVDENHWRREGLSQSGEGADDVDAHLHRTRAVQDGRRHDGAVFGEGQGLLAAPTPT